MRKTRVKKKRKIDKQTTIVAATIIVCFLMVVITGTYLNEDWLTSSFSMRKDSKFFYAISTTEYVDILLARERADIIKSQGGAGYIKLGESIEVFFSAYKSQADAESVLNNMGTVGGTIKEIEITHSKLKWVKSKDKVNINNALNYFDLTYNHLDEIIHKLATFEYTLSDALFSIDIIIALIDKLIDDFNYAMRLDTSNQIDEIRLALITAKALVQNINTNKTMVECLSSTRYQQIQLLYIHQYLMSVI